MRDNGTRRDHDRPKVKRVSLHTARLVVGCETAGWRYTTRLYTLGARNRDSISRDARNKVRFLNLYVYGYSIYMYSICGVHE